MNHEIKTRNDMINLQRVNEINKQIIEGGWDGFYKNKKIEEIPWIDKELDFDLEEELINMQLNKGVFLDLGTGTGTQAIQLAQRGFDVIGSDISETIINKNKINYESKYTNIKFIVDNGSVNLRLFHLSSQMVFYF